MEAIELVYSLFNQYLYQEAKNNIELIDYYFATNPNTAGNPLIDSLIDSIKKYELSAIDVPLFQSILMKLGKTPNESNKIMMDIGTWKQYNKQQIAPARQFLQDVCADALIRKAQSLYQKHPSEFLKYLKNTDFKVNHNDVMNTTGFGEIDINTIIAEQQTSGIASRHQWINESYDPFKKYETGQMVMICLPPGVGKTLFAMGEALFMASNGHKVHFMAMGDMKPKDFVIRMGAIYSGLPFSEVQLNLGPIYNGLKQTVGNNLGLTIVPAAKVTVDQYIEYIKDKDFDVLFIDYDSNFLSNASDNMYSEYGEIYDKLTELTQLGKLIFVCAQPKVGVWGNEIIQLSDVGESSRKQHSADMIITGGRVVGNQNHLGTFKIAKNRRGEEGIEQPYIRLKNGRFKALPQGVYDTLKEFKERRDYAEVEIDAMINQYMSNLQNINRGMNRQQMNNSGNNQAPQHKPAAGPF